MFSGESEVLLLVIPQGSPDPIPVHDSMNILQPAEHGAFLSQVDHSVFAAVQRHLVFFSLLQGRSKYRFKEFLPRLAAGVFSYGKSKVRRQSHLRRLIQVVRQFSGVTDPEITRHGIHPVRTLMCENDRLIAVEIIDDLIIQRDVQKRHACHAVIAHTADDQITVRHDGSHKTNVRRGYFIPCVSHFLQHDLIERLKRHLVLVIREPVRDPAPQVQETGLKILVIEELLSVHILLQRVK